MRDPNQIAQKEQVKELGAKDQKNCVLSENAIQTNNENPSSNLSVDVCVEAMGGISIEAPPASHQTSDAASTQNRGITNIPPEELPNRSPCQARLAFRRYVSAPAVLRNRIQVTQHQVEVSRSSFTLADIILKANRRSQKPFLVRKVRARAALSTRPIPPVVRTGWETVDKSVILAEVPEILAQDKTEWVEEMLHLRGGCGSWMGKKGNMRRLEDDEELPPMIWWLSGGKPGQSLPTGSKLRWWKAKSKGQWRTGHRREYLQELAFVLSDGRLCRNEPGQREGEKCTEQEKSNELERTDNVTVKKTIASAEE
ncbi:hypothetical protein H112_04064 [Trichophyton rubrum D6]|uniref:Uncharacterized protein n=4 Tax=Trichophyton TaxID=5550 RepID=A0A178EXV3_TRIRU|nr:uncharacterized protein TERG_05387 [Trichophyton rubrum CBS 118892]EZF23360.1 hypothetical protein H100_04070 [Trichophyton rubrum MR850]EZF42331.1 hypothetical protein H102_04057 [Trichophyton rubrum CBS 100081]EZF52916.1 hypothetical protein H103_04071 [Trichophyton rubrum CBS 288.86]EZF63518.1 hypothetical protein H104_04057 [Trichophyton rubrum CBS 289.86]EZF74409.1 hypothetical protein H105_04086 [Trichophyton soudanense CBS 452.61]EZF84902.1 hypothetical protein H110_04064 [Trichophy